MGTLPVWELHVYISSKEPGDQPADSPATEQAFRAPDSSSPNCVSQIYVTKEIAFKSQDLFYLMIPWSAGSIPLGLWKGRTTWRQDCIEKEDAYLMQPGSREG